MPSSQFSTALHDLRRRAQRPPAAGQPAHPAAPPTDPAAPPTDPAQLVEALQTHQLELELQYEELLVAHAQLEASRTQYAALYYEAPVGYCTLDHQGVLRHLNRHASQLLGYPADQLLSHPLALYVETGSLAQLTRLLHQLRTAPGQRHSAWLALRRPGSPAQRVQATGVYGHNHEDSRQPRDFHLVLLDVSAQHAATTALAASEARFRATFEQSRDGIVLLENHCFAAANDAALRLLGLGSRPQVLGRPLGECWPDEQPDGQTTAALLGEGLREAEVHGWCRLELRRRTPAGEWVWDELSVSPVVLQGQTLLHGALRDITARKHIEQQLHQREAQLQQALAAADTGVWSLDLATNTLHPDAQAQEIFGFGPGLPFAVLQATLHPDDLPGMEQTLANAARTHAAFDVELRLLRADGTVRYAAATGSFDYDPATGQARHLRGLVRDTTTRRLAEEELTYKNRLLENLLHSVPMVLVRIGTDGRFREYAGPPLRVLGLADNELVGRLAAEEFPASAGRFRQLLAGSSVSYIATLARRGRTLHLQVFGFFDPERQEGILFGTDISEAEQLKEEATRARLRQQQQLVEAVLAAQETERSRIAESLHNGLGQLLYATKLQLDRLPATPGQPGRLEAGRLLSESIRQTRAISHELSPALLEAHGLKAALQGICLHMSGAGLRWQCHLVLDEAPPLPQPLQVAVYRLAQELAQNVVKHAQAHHATLEVEVLPGWLVLRVEDDGRGFDPATASQGLGLRTLRNRVALLGGTLHLDAAPGRGTQVQLRLPLADAVA